MKHSVIIIVLLFACFFAGAQNSKVASKSYIIGKGQMPNLAKDKQNNLHLVYGSGDSILYAYSADNGNSFSAPSLIAVLPHVFTYATRGPQIAATDDGLIVIAATSTGDIHTFCKRNNGSWTTGGKVNDIALSAKEGLTALSADGKTAFAVWLDTRGNERNKIYGAKSTDGGKTWSKNMLVYASPDTNVCECCKPSVVMKGDNIYVMFRNWLNGCRDLYLTQSTDGGLHFNEAKKIGTGTWKLNGCPMDGGGLAVDEKGVAQTVWRRNDTIYSAAPGAMERAIGQGKGCTIAHADGNNIYAWVNNGEIVVLNAAGRTAILGEGKQPVIKALDNKHILCIWENEKRLYASVLQI